MSKDHLMHLYPISMRTVYCGVVCLSAAAAVLAVGGHGVHLHGVVDHGVRQQGVGHVDRRWDSTALATDHAGTPLAGTATQVELAHPALVSTAEKRELLTYLVRCALPEDIAVYAQHGPDRFTFHGRLGLAPRWLYEAMTPSEERWVSACLLAHVNYFGKSILISLRARQPTVPALMASEDEQRTFTIFEGGFFGNLFLPSPVAYTCQGDRTPAQARDPILQDRVCTQETGATTADGRPMTFCHFLVTGRCDDAATFTVEGTHYTEVLFTYLRPHTP
jgi:hypothetical protein